MLIDMLETKLGCSQIHFHNRNLKLSIMPIHAGHEFIIDKTYSWNGLERGKNEMAIFQYTISGRGKLVYLDKEYNVLPGHAMLLSIPHNHCYSLPENSESWEFIYFALYGREAMRIWRDIQGKVGPIVYLGDKSATIKELVNVYNVMLAGNISTEFKASSLTYNFVMTILEDIIPLNSEGKVCPNNLSKAVDYCIKNFYKPIGVEDMANASQYSKYHFSRLFLRFYGKSPNKFLQDIRLKYAVRLLQTEHFTIKEVSYKSGFNSSGYFCKVFAKEYKVSPDKFRKGI